MRRSTGQRTAALLLAVLAQGSLVALYILPQLQEPEHDPESSPLILIWPEDPPAPKPPQREPLRKSIAPALPQIAVIASNSTVSAEPFTPPEEAAPLTQQIDLQQAIALSIQEILKQEAEREKHGELLHSKPDVLKIPELRQLPPAVVTERLDNGDMVTRHRISEDLTIVCDHPHMPLALHFDVTARVRPALCRAVDTRDPRMWTVDSVKPRYLRRPLSTPKPRSAP